MILFYLVRNVVTDRVYAIAIPRFLRIVGVLRFARSTYYNNIRPRVMDGWGGKDFTDTNDEYETPMWLAEQCIQAIQYHCRFDILSVLDPCAGRGQWKKAAEKNCSGWLIDEFELTQGKDFYQTNLVGMWDMIMGNPPFSNLTKWLEKTVSLEPKVIAYLLPSTALSYKRLANMEGRGYRMGVIKVIENPREWNLGYPHFLCIWCHRAYLKDHTSQLLPGTFTEQTSLRVWN